MRRVALALLLLAACTREQPPKPMPKVSGDITGRVIDAETKQPVTKFVVAVFSGTERFLYQLPPGYPIPPGRLVAEKIIESADGSFTLPSYPGPVYIGVSAEGHERYMSEAMEVTKPLTISLAPSPVETPSISVSPRSG